MTMTTPVRTKWAISPLLGIGGGLIVALIVLAFVWPAATLKLRDLPVGISGPAAQVTQLSDALAKQDPNPVKLVTVTDRADAVQRIQHREIFGAVLLGDSPEVLIASGAGAAPAQLLRGIATNLQQGIDTGAQTALIAQLKQLSAALSAGAVGGAGGAAPSSGSSGAPTSIPTVTVTDLAPLAASDPTGGAISAAGFPIVLGGMLGGVIISLLVVGSGRRVLALVVYGIVAGVGTTLVLQTWLGVLQGQWWLNASAFGVAMLATGALVVGMNSLIGRAGIAVGAVISLLIANPISGSAFPHEFIVAPWGDVGQYFVPGSAAALIRGLSYFPDSDPTRLWLTIGAWAVGGLLLTVLGHFRSSAPIRLPEAELEPAPHS
jgi:hypothetical protein